MCTIWDKDVARDVKDGRLLVPSMRDVGKWVFDTLAEAACPCGAMVEHDGHCEHGRPSWPMALGLI